MLEGYSNVQKVYSLCNRYQWFTHGTNTQYERMFDMVREKRKTKDIALVIFICSEGYTEKQIYDILKSEGI